MKYEPLTFLGLYAVAGAGQAQRDPQQFFDFMLALALGGFCALVFSLWKSRKKCADTYDTATWAVIATMGSTALAYFLAPILDGREVPLTGIALTAPLVAFVTTIAATPFIEWSLEGGLWRKAKDAIDKEGKG